MSINLLKVDGKDLYDFTDICDEITRRSSDSEISEEVSFSTKGKYLSEGDRVIMMEYGKKLFEGIVVDVKQGEFTSEVNCFDFGWYLNKNEDAYQFNATCTDCITRVCKDHGIPVGSIASMRTVYNKVKKGNIADIIKDIIEYHEKSTGIKHIWYMSRNKLYVEKQDSNIVVYNTNVNNTTVEITKLLSKPSLSSSIDNLYNAIKVVNQEDNSINVLAYAEDRNSIGKYGRLQKLETVTKEETSNARNVATGQLKLLNKIKRNLSVTLLGVSECRANKILYVENDIMNIKGKFIIKSCEHSYTKSLHLMSLSLEVI